MSQSAQNHQQGIVAMTLILTGILALVVGGALFYFAQIRVSQIPTAEPIDSTTLTEVPKDSAGQVITKSSTSPSSEDQKLAQLKKDVLVEVDKKVATLSGNTTSGGQKEAFVYFGVSGATRTTSWEDLSGSEIKFNPASYPGAKAFYFQANLQTDAPDRIGYARIYDLTHSTGVAGSDISYIGLSPAFKQSSGLIFSAGDLQLNVQLRSELNLTTIYNPRIKIVY